MRRHKISSEKCPFRSAIHALRNLHLIAWRMRNPVIHSSSSSRPRSAKANSIYTAEKRILHRIQQGCLRKIWQNCVWSSDIHFSEPKELLEIMARSEDCLHCANLQAEFEELRSQHRIMQDQVRSLETRMEDQYRILNEKYRTEINLFLHRVSSLHEQFRNLANRCSHAEESITILQYMDKKNKELPSSSSAKQVEPDPNPEESTARQISHIYID